MDLFPFFRGCSYKRVIWLQTRIPTWDREKNNGGVFRDWRLKRRRLEDDGGGGEIEKGEGKREKKREWVVEGNRDCGERKVP